MAYRKSKKGAAIRRWLEEKWTDQHGRECGSSETKGVKKCRPSKKISGKTPKTWGQVDKNKEVAKKRRVGMGNRTSKAKHGGEACFTNTGVRIPGMIKKK